MIKNKEELINTLKKRFEDNLERHKNMDWAKIEEKLNKNEKKLWSLNEMEKSGGEPDVIFYDEKTDEYIFYDASPETPLGRRNTCYDKKGQDERNKKGIFPEGNALDMAEEMGIELLNEEEYRKLQTAGIFDTKTSSWLKTPSEIRKLGGAIFADFRYGQVFVYHNSAPSFYSSRAFRGLLRV